MRAVDLLGIIFALFLLISCARGIFAMIYEVNLLQLEWGCSQYTDWRIYEDEQKRDCVQYTKKEEAENERSVK